MSAISRIAIMILSVVAALASTSTATAGAFAACTFDEASGRLNVEILAQDVAVSLKRLFLDGPDQILLGESSEFDPLVCDVDPDAIDSVAVSASVDGGQLFRPYLPIGVGATPESEGEPEIEYDIDLGTGADSLHLWECRNCFGADPYPRQNYFDITSATEVHLNTDGDVDLVVAPGVDTWLVNSGVGDDVIRSSLGIGFLVIVHTAVGNDDIVTRGSDDLIESHGGDDRIVTGAGNDAAEGGASRDLIRTGGGDDLLDGGNNADVLRGGAGNDRIWAADGTSDVVDCGLGLDEVVSADPEDELSSNCEQGP